MAGYLATAAMLTALLAAPLIFGTYAVVPRSDAGSVALYGGCGVLSFGTVSLLSRWAVR